MLHFSSGVTRLDKIRYERIRGTAHIRELGEKMREARLRWYENVRRREEKYAWKKDAIELPGKKQKSPRRRDMDCINGGMAEVGVTRECIYRCMLITDHVNTIMETLYGVLILVRSFATDKYSALEDLS